jgi:S-adenosylmethionine:diacylglycerol 3-amino-3-carboxypropyl transferase
MTAKKRIQSKVDSNAVSVESTALLGLLADIRAAVGDPTGKLMQDELIAHCRTLREERDWMAHLLATIRDKADIRYGKNRGLLAFSDLKDEAARSRPNNVIGQQSTST